MPPVTVSHFRRVRCACSVQLVSRAFYTKPEPDCSYCRTIEEHRLPDLSLLGFAVCQMAFFVLQRTALIHFDLAVYFSVKKISQSSVPSGAGI